jgi:methionyl-tRNA formyltransferase
MAAQLDLVFFGSPAGATLALRAVIAREHRVIAAYTQPDRAAGRSGAPVPTPFRAAAEQAGIPVRTPKSLRDAAAQKELAGFKADAFIVVAYGKLLPPDVLRLPRLGTLNIHPSLLPKYRGPSPVQQAVLDGVPQTGVTVMLLDEGMDTGPVLAQESVRLRGDETAGALTGRLFEMGAELLAETLDRWVAGEVRPRPQAHAEATVTKLLSREDGEVDWLQPAERIARMVRAYDPWPGVHTRWRGQAVKILEARAVSGAERKPPGEVSTTEGGLLVATGVGALELLRLQLEGRRPLPANEFLRGHPDFASAMLPS